MGAKVALAMAKDLADVDHDPDGILEASEEEVDVFSDEVIITFERLDADAFTARQCDACDLYSNFTFMGGDALPKVAHACQKSHWKRRHAAGSTVRYVERVGLRGRQL